jgi:aryl-alcohol dehydrogenase-like predicted oxidoreductase
MQAIDHVAKAHKATPMQVALAWLLQRSPKMLTIPGTSSVKHLDENLGRPDLRLAKDEYNELANVQELTFSR